MMYYLKTAVILILRIALYAFRIFPVKKNRILFSSYEGRAFNDSPAHIFKYILEHDGAEWQYIWCLNNKGKLPEQYRKTVKVVRFLSLSHLYYLMTSKAIISNLGIEPFIPKRKSQIYINTWHGGGAYKRVAFDIDMFSRAHKFYSKRLRDLRKHSNYWFLSSCRKFSEISSKDFDVPQEKFLSSGMPRNDMLLSTGKCDRTELRERLAAQYGLDPESLWVLYAPTFRGTYREQKHIENLTNDPKLSDAFEKRFGRKVQILNRAHISKEETPSQFASERFDVSSYPDMQPLLLACDVLITDYSSSMWDYAQTRKPGFLLVPDLDEYERNVGFYTPIDDWAHPYARTIDELCRLVEEYDESAAIEKIERHLKLLQSYEAGHACHVAYELIHEREPQK